jgi:hypothetical protein
MKLAIKHAMLSMLIFFSVGAAADTLKYTGEIADVAGNPLNGKYLITFSLYDDPEGYIIWEETQDVVVQDGHYEVVLGSNNPIKFPADKDYYLEITVGGSPELAAHDVVTPAGKKPKTFNKPVIITKWLTVEGKFTHGCPAGMANAGGFCIHTISPYPRGLNWWESLDACIADGYRLCSQSEVVNALRAGVLKQYYWSEGDIWYATASQAENSPGTSEENQVCNVQGNINQPNHLQYSVQCNHEKSWTEEWKMTVCCY